jgi:hypothetical protein
VILSSLCRSINTVGLAISGDGDGKSIYTRKAFTKNKKNKKNKYISFVDI